MLQARSNVLSEIGYTMGAKEINRLSCDISQLIEFNSNNSYPSIAWFFIQSVALLKKFIIIGFNL